MSTESGTDDSCLASICALREDRKALGGIASTTGNHGSPRLVGAQTKADSLRGLRLPAPGCGRLPARALRAQHDRALGRSRRIPGRDARAGRGSSLGPASSLPPVSPEAGAHEPPLPTPPGTHPRPRAPARWTAGERASPRPRRRRPGPTQAGAGEKQRRRIT
ncbi:hypothetical protein ACRRTK_021388 [Alexandromys fortis]